VSLCKVSFLPIVAIKSIFPSVVMLNVILPIVMAPSMQSVDIKSILTSVIMPNVILPRVVAPYKRHLGLGIRITSNETVLTKIMIRVPYPTKG